MAMTSVGFQAPQPGVARTGQAPAPAPAQAGVAMNCNTASIIYQGMDLPINIVPPATVVAGVVVPGALPVNFTPCEPVVLVDFEISDPSGKLLICDVRTCRSVIFEGGFFSAQALQSASTSRPQWTRALQRLILMQTVPLVIRFCNPVTVGAGFDIQGGLLVSPIALSQQLPAENEALFALFNRS